MPSDILLHYNYGAAAVKWWGHGVEVLHGRFNPPRPKPVLAPSSGPLTTPGSGDRTTPDDEVTWEENLVLFLSANSRASKNRRLKKTQENVQRMERWRNGLPYV